MCGIFAEFTKSSLNSIDVKDEIIDLLKHRGPDNQGLFINESILFEKIKYLKNSLSRKL